MFTKIIRIIAAIILILLPFFPITENFFPLVTNENFTGYLVTFIVLMVAGIALAGYLTHGNSFTKKPGWIFIVMGLLALYPLHLGPPAIDANLLNVVAIERSRYAVLLLAVLLFAAGCWYAINISGKGAGKNILLLFIVLVTVGNIWDNFSSYQMSSQLQQWVSNGKNAADFFGAYNDHIVWRAVVRMGLYLAIIVLLILLVKQAWVKKWQAACIIIFSLIGFVCCIVFLQKGFEYYFPFMIPAVALAPAYWTGISLLSASNKNK